MGQLYLTALREAQDALDGTFSCIDDDRDTYCLLRRGWGRCRMDSRARQGHRGQYGCEECNALHDLLPVGNKNATWLMA